MNTRTQTQVRRATTDDVSALALLRYEFRSRRKTPIEGAAEFVPRCTEWMRSRIADETRWRVWTLVDRGTIVGNIWLQIVEKLPNPNVERERHGYVTNFFVRPEYRNTGAGSRLLDALLGECRGLEIDSVFLWPSDRSRPLYERHGFMTPSTMLVLEDR
jgi:N-acetylglutamate synthase-like GNAT family acetyltransferase